MATQLSVLVVGNLAIARVLIQQIHTRTLLGKWWDFSLVV